MKNPLCIAYLFGGLAGAVAMAQTLPTLAPANAGAATVSGRVAAGAAPVSIYDLSYPTKTMLGSGGSVDGNGNFAVSVKPVLIAGHQIVVVDGHGNTSLPVTVSAPTAGPKGPGN
jgi:hypothetical protein